MAAVSDGNGHDVEQLVHAAVDRAVEVRVGAIDVALNQRIGPFEKYQAEVSGGITRVSHEVAGLRDEVVALKGVCHALAAELRKDRLSRDRRRKRRTQ